MRSQALVFLGAKRTPFGANGGSLRDSGPVDLALTAAKAAFEQAGVTPDQVDHVIVGNVLPATSDTIYIPRHLGLRAGIPIEVPALGINRLCGTGFQVIIEAFQQMSVGEAEVALVGGVENMSMAPYVLRSARWGMKMGHQSAADMMTECLTDELARAPMGITAENLAVRYGVSRLEADQWAELSQKRAEAAIMEGRLKDEISPIEISDRKGVRVLSVDEHPRSGTTAESLSRLKPVFKKDGVVTAGNASGIVDGAAMMVVSSEERASRQGWSPIGRMVAYAVAGCDPSIMGIGPVPAIQKVLKRTSLKLDDMDLIEVNEAFAPQLIAVERELGLPRERLNVDGGAIAIGHPLAASGTRLVMHLLYELRRRKKKFGLGSACIGGGQGIAMIIEAF